ncbi:MAG: proline iminopeptidase-family hydrolase [Actinomycetota bacterium]
MTQDSEGFLDVPGGKVWFHVVGDLTAAPPLLCLHGGPGFPSYSQEPLDRLAGDRAVVRWDQLGCGRSERPDDVFLWTIERFVEEVDVVRSALGVEQIHLYGHSWGGMLAMEYVIRRKPELQSLILSSAPADTEMWERDTAALKATLPPETQEAIETHEAAGTYDAPEYQAAMREYYVRYVTRMDPLPYLMQKTIAEAGMPVYNHMWGPSEFTVTGTLRGWSVLDRVHEIDVHTLLLVGEYDECTPAHVAAVHERLPSSEMHVFEGAGHSTLMEKTEEYLALLKEFLDRMDARDG